MRQTSAPALAAGIRRFTYADASAPALSGINLSLDPGTLTVVLGGSGSGKTTLGRLLAGWLRPGSAGAFEGSLELAGTRLEFQGSPEDPRIDPAAWCRHVGFVPQDAAAALSSVRATVAEELAFGLENLGTAPPEMRHAVRRMASLIGLDHLLDRAPAKISGGELRRLAIGCAVITGPAVLVLDEPAASLDTQGAADLTALVRSLVAGGTAVVVLSQAVDALAGEADHWIILNNGSPVGAGVPEQLATSPALIAAGIVATGHQPDGLPKPQPARARPTPFGALPGAAPALEFRDVSFAFQPPGARRWFGRTAGDAAAPAVLDGINLVVEPGEIVAVMGPNGAGKSTLLRHLNGLLQPLAGTVRINGKDIAGQLPGAVAADVGLLFQEPRDQLFERTAEREVAFGLAGSPPASASVRRALAAVGLTEAAAKHPAELPSSQRRLLALATVLVRQPRIVALDEPTVGLDRHALARLDTAVRDAAAEGAAVVLVTHDGAYARHLAHRTVVLAGGKLRAG